MKKPWVLLFTIFFCLFAGAQDKAPQSNDSTAKNLKLNLLPVLFYLPETGFGFGGLGLATFRFKDEPVYSRPSSTQLGLSFTTKNQLLLFAPYELYWDDEKWRLLGELGFYKYFYNFYGLGIDSREADFETYNVTFPRVRASLLREILPNISVGLGYELDIFYDLQIEENGILQATDIDGKNDGGTQSNIGLRAFYDSRDNIFLPTKGFFVQADAFTSASFLGSTFTYSRISLDARYYQQIKGDHIMAFNTFIGVNSEDAPLYDLNYLGSKRTRGFNDRRYQDLAELSLVVEYRFPIAGRFGGVAFASNGTVAPDFGELFKSRYRASGGVGLRYLLNKKDGVRIRADYGISPEGGNFYFTIREAF